MKTLSQNLHIVIIGGGITGLSAAHALEQHAPGIRYTVLERSERFGGKIRSEIADANGRVVLEVGPDSILTQKPWALALARSLGLGERLIGNNLQRKTVFLFSRGKLVPMPENLVLVVPTKMRTFLRSGLLSPLGRLRVLLDMLLPARRDPADESLGSFFRRRMGREMLERMAEPLLSGIHNAECERQSLLATFPRFHTMERTSGSLIRTLRAERRKRAGQPAPATSPFVSFPNGLQELIDALGSQLHGDLRLNSGVRSIQQTASGYTIVLENDTTLHADAVIVTTPASAAAPMLADAAPDLAALLANVRYVSTGIVSLAFRAADAATATQGTGVLVPRVEGRMINAVTVSSTKWAGRAPDDVVLLRVFLGGSHRPTLLDLDDDALVGIARTELRELLGITAEPLLRHISRWPDANPQYDVGHLERVAAMEAACPPGLLLAGCNYRGVGIPDCVQQGEAAAASALAFVGFSEQNRATVPTQ